MTSVVLDASVVAAWFLQAQATPGSEALLARAHELEFHAPHLFFAEVGNLLVMAERRGAYDPAATAAALTRLLAYDITVEPPPQGSDLLHLLTLARDERLTVYDALYLELAARRGWLLASRDADLLAAAQRRGVHVDDLRDLTR